MRISLRTACGLLLAAMLCFVGDTAHAQFRASIQGTVTDSSGAAIPGATVVLLDKNNNHTVTATSGSDGNYTFNALPPDHFKITTTMNGFETRVLDNVTLIPEQANTVNISLAVGGASEVVTVNAESVPNLDTATATISGTVTSNQITHMPSFGRDVTQLAQLAPGSFADDGQGASGGTRSLPGTNQGGPANNDGIFKTENGPQVVANGNQTNTNSVLIDGISASSVTWGGTTVVTPTEESVDSVKVSSNAYDAEFGRFTGAQIQITSKSGTNQIHGSLFFKADRPGLNAYQRWNGPNSVGAPAAGKTPAQRGLNRDTGRFNQFGGSVGGPVWRNKIFAFFAYETLRQQTVSFSTGYYETSSFLKEAPSGSIASQYTTFPGIGASSTGLASFSCSDLGLTEGSFCHAIANQGLDIGSPLTTPLGTYDQSRSLTDATQPGYGNGLDGIADVANYSLVSPNSRTASQYYGRMDGQVTSKDRLSFMIYWVPLTTVSYNGPVRSTNLWNHTQINNAFTGLWNHTFTPSLLNEARANAAGWRWNEVSTNPQEAFGLPSLGYGDQRGMFPGTTPNVLSASGPSVFNQWTYGYQDIATKTLGRHTIKVGASITRLYYLNENVGGARPTYKFANLWDFLNDAVYQESGTFTPSTGQPTPNRQDDRNNFWGIFVQDDFKVLPTLTINLGLRYDHFGPLYDKDQNQRVVVLGAGTAEMTGLSLRKGGGLYSVQNANFGPQFGFAWNPKEFAQKLVVRGGFGLNYNQNELAITAQASGNPGNTYNATFCCKDKTGASNTGASIVYSTAGNIHSIYSYPVNPNATTPYNSNGLPSSASTTTSVTAFDANDKTIATYHFSMDTEYAISKGWVATLGYEGSVSHHLLLQEDLNVVAAVNGIPLNKQITRVGYYGNIGNANYHAMLATLKHNFSHSYQMEAQYTWAKSMDNGSQPYYQDVYPYQMAYSYGRSDYNVKDAFKVFGMYQPNFFHNALMHAIADGWTLTGIYNWHTGFPWTPTYGTSANLFYGNSGQGTLRPAAYNGRGGHDLSNNAFESGPNALNPAVANSNFSQGALTYFTPPTFTAVPTGSPITTTAPPPQAPGIDRNSFDGPHYEAVDASITKGFHLPKMPVLGESAIIEFRADAFNIFNQVNLNNPSSNINTNLTTSNVNFGQSSSALAGRIVDLQARFSF